jgi:D-3-phosphoglycerate dehydrogenase
MLLLYLGPESTLKHVIGNLQKGFEVRLALDEMIVNEIIKDCDVILDAYMKIPFPADRINAACQLKLFVTATTGSDHIDSSSLVKRGIPLLTLHGQKDLLRNITPAAEHSWLLLMACARHLGAAIQGVLGGEWDRNKYPGMMLRGRTLGIIGCGRIGQWMATYAAAFGMRCMGYDPYVAPWPEGIEKSSIEELLKLSDFITVHVPLENKTYGLLGAYEFSLMKQGAILINTSRGDVISETALLLALQEGRLAAVGLDVVSGEPNITDHPLVDYARKHHNLIITPHIGGFSPDALKCILEFSCRRILDFFEI